MRGGGDQRVGDVARFERFVGAAIGEEAAFAVRVDERDQPPCLAIRIADEMGSNADLLEARRLAFDVGGADAPDEIDTRAAPGEPRRLVGGRAARLNRNRRASIRAAHDRPFRPHNDIRHHVADDEDARRPGHSDMAGATGARDALGLAGICVKPAISRNCACGRSAP